ncbi:MAG: SRPBCC family protein [Actinomycetales bacterium]|nr:MAG: SRPBCC family protein [Actinomycetales bacterium]
MRPVTVTQEVPSAPDDAFAALTEWQRHGDVVPFTSVRITDTGFVARTAVGPLGFDDVMDVVEWTPPHAFRIEKRGRMVKGWATVTVVPHGSGSLVSWTEAVHVWGVPRLGAGVEAFFARLLVRRLLGRLTRS